MNRSVHDQFDGYVARILRTVSASPWRRRAMAEELRGHLLAAYDEELARAGAGDRGDAAAADAAVRRMGDAAELVRQIQASVPVVERGVFYLLSGACFISHWKWFAAVFAFFFGPGMVLPALARHKQQGVPWSAIAPYVATGTLVTLVGLVAIAYGLATAIRGRRGQNA